MMTGILIALAAGLASATMFASISSGALIALVLFYMAPLPLMVAALGWGSATALIGGIAATIGLGLLFSSFSYATAFALTVALPAWWLGRLALLARPVSSDPQLAGLAPALDWYPTGRVLAWIAAFAALFTISALLTLGTDEITINATLRSGLQRILSGTGTSGGDSDRVVDVLVRLAPAAATMIAMLTLTFNLWLAGRVTVTSGRLKRPWPDLRTTTLPRRIVLVLIVAVALSFVGGLIAMIAQVVSTALLMTYAITGFAVLHTLTQALSGRAFILGSAYAATLFIGWPVIAMACLGLADAVFGIRQTYWTRRGPPPLPIP